MEVVRSRLSREVVPASAMEDVDEGWEMLVAGSPVARLLGERREGCS